jgi:hypothetical protein
MGNFQVRVGGFYVNESKGLVREITHERENGDGKVHWRSYYLDDGRPTGDSLLCEPYRILQWADREATPEEVARMDQRAATLRGLAKGMELVALVLPNVPSDSLLAEIQRRGFDEFLREIPDDQLFAEVRRRGRQVL